VNFTKFLIDECLTKRLASVAKKRAYWAQHVGQNEKLNGSSDWDLIRTISDGDYIFVTNNAKDFIPLYKKLNIHNGLIVIVPSCNKLKQSALFAAALERLSVEADIINKIMFVELDGSISIEDWPR
jgi:predicted nuclease of predicted toxin-antitoxin system